MMSIARSLVVVSWTLWGGISLLVLWWFVTSLFDTTQSPEVSSGFGVVVGGCLLLVTAGVGVWLWWAIRQRSSAWVVVITLLVAYPLAMLVVIPAVRAFKNWSFERELARVGDFPDPATRQLARAVEGADAGGLRRLLAGTPLPAGRDRAGNDLLAFAALVVRDRDGDPETVRVLLEAGADPRVSRTADGEALLHFMLRGRSPSSVAVVRLFLQHGVDPDDRDPLTGKAALAGVGDRTELVELLVQAGADVDQLMPEGDSTLVRFISMQHWDSALYLVEQGARLDLERPDGLSVDYYLKEYRDSVYGTHPVGWDRVREAILVRRGSAPQ